MAVCIDIDTHTLSLEYLGKLDLYTYFPPFVLLQKLSSKYAFQRHQQWLQHAKTRSARHKIMKVGLIIIDLLHS